MAKLSRDERKIRRPGAKVRIQRSYDPDHETLGTFGWTVEHEIDGMVKLTKTVTTWVPLDCLVLEE